VPKTESLVRPLLTWFAGNARDLPWRRTTDPYAIWISEIMLQQTQVTTVIPYWERWMRQLPDVRALARAKPDRVLKLWEGLGYYTRARNAQRAAQIIVARPGGLFPVRFDEVLALPGVGRYTAGAICSIAFNQPSPILDGNVIRVLTRLFGIGQNPRERETNERLWSLAGKLVKQAAEQASPGARDCSNLNQALMELGATVCAPKQPKCPACPLRRFCIAHRDQRVALLPNLGPRVESVARRFIAFVIRDGGRVLVRQRPSGVVNGQLWEFPNIEPADAAPDVLRLAEQCLGFAAHSLKPLFQIKHTITRHRIQLEVHCGERARGAVSQAADGRWRRLNELEKLAFPSAHRKIVEALRSQNPFER
jgi:A/G-specific adenine glycosylase